MRKAPARLAVWLLTRRLSAEWGDFILGDREVEFEVGRSVSARAHAWFLCRRSAASPRRRRLAVRRCCNHPLPRNSMTRTLLADLRYGLRVLFRRHHSHRCGRRSCARHRRETAIFSIVNAVLLRCPSKNRIGWSGSSMPPQAGFRHAPLLGLARQLRLEARGDSSTAWPSTDSASSR
jgi:hypothetical protein